MANLLHFQPHFHMDLHFHVLSALDLRNDAASVFSGQTKPWSEELKEAYLAAPGRLMAHGVPLLAGDFSELLAWLRGDRLSEFRDESGRRLATRLADILQAEAPAHRAAWDADAGARDRRQQALGPWLAELEAVCSALWSDSKTEPGTVLVHDCPSLATREGTRGRSMLWSGALHVALGLGGPLEQVLCQLIHEAVHVVTDPPIRKAHAQMRQDTRVGNAAFALHRELERSAVEEGGRLIAERAPRLVKGYDIWRRRHGC